MICKVRNTIEKYGMLPRGSSVIVGLSGGADSCTLLYILSELKEEYSLNICAAHLNHGIRGEEALSDEKFAKNFCKKLGVQFYAKRVDVPALAKQHGMSEEEYGRRARYEFFKSIDPGALVATAHNLSDCCETLIFNIVRGSGIKGLCSIPPVRDNIIRPLFECSRSEIEAFCRQNGIDYVTDSTNNDDTFSRNRIRLNVIPELKKINPDAESAFMRVICAAREDEGYFEAVTQKIISEAQSSDYILTEKLMGLHPAVLSRVISKLITINTGILPQSIHIKAVESILGGGKTQISGGIPVICRNGELHFGEIKKTEPWSREFLLDEEIITPNRTVKFNLIHKNKAEQKQFVHKNVLDFESITGNLTLRSRIAGDEIRIAGRNCTKTVKKLFTESKIKDKNAVIILCDEAGPVWVEGFGCAERCRITAKTQKILKVVL